MKKTSILICVVLISFLLQAWQGYIPYVKIDDALHEVKRGLAMAYYHSEDLDRAIWFYTWGACNSDPKCIPMSYAGLDPNLPIDYSGWLLVFNEPNNPAPYGANISPQLGAQRYLALKDEYPNAKMVVGNVSAWSVSWLIDFKTACNCTPDAWGIHGYIESYLTVINIENYWNTAHNIMGGEFWITEWADTRGDIVNDETLKTWLNTQSWVTHWAYFTNRAQGNEVWWPSNWVTQLFDYDTGQPTTLGIWWNGPGSP